MKFLYNDNLNDYLKLIWICAYFTAVSSPHQWTLIRYLLKQQYNIQHVHQRDEDLTIKLMQVQPYGNWDFFIPFNFISLSVRIIYVKIWCGGFWRHKEFQMLESWAKHKMLEELWIRQHLQWKWTDDVCGQANFRLNEDLNLYCLFLPQMLPVPLSSSSTLENFPCFRKYPSTPHLHRQV